MRLLLISLALLVISCKSDYDPKKQDTPKALTDNSESELSLSSYKSRDQDLVERLYKEIVEKDKELQQLESNIQNLYASKTDSLESFNEFDAKNKSYYQTATSMAEAINDSLFKIKIKAFVARSDSAYNQKISRHNKLLQLLDEKEKALNDLRISIKIIRTLPLIEKFQQNNLPQTKPIEHILNQYDKVLKQADAQSKK